MYEIIYQLVSADLFFGPTQEIERLTGLAIEGRIEPCRTVTLGCDVERDTINLARWGFDVVGVDFSNHAIAKARRNAERSGLIVPFVVDDLTKPQRLYGTYDLATDFGARNDMVQDDRDLYLENALPLMVAGSHFENETLYSRHAGKHPATLRLYGIRGQA